MLVWYLLNEHIIFGGEEADEYIKDVITWPAGRCLVCFPETA